MASDSEYMLEEFDLATGGRTRMAVAHVMDGLEMENVVKLMVGHDDGCPAIDSTLDTCNCEIVRVSVFRRGYPTNGEE